MPTPSYEVLWLVTPEQDMYVVSKVVTGLIELARTGFVSVQYSTRTPFTVTGRGAIYLEARSTATGQLRRIALDLQDRADRFYSVALAFADVYFKRGFLRSEVEKLPPDLRAKVRPFGLNYSCLAKSARGVHLAVPLSNLLKGSMPSNARRLRKFWEDIKLLKGLPPPDLFEQSPEAARELTVLFQTRVWPPEESTDNLDQVNHERATLVRTLRAEFGDRAIGGVVADSYSREFCPDVLAETNTQRFLYLRLLKRSTVAIYTRGLHHSLAFKLAEYLASGLGIVSEPLLHELPVPLEAGVHYLPFTTHEECIRQCRRLLDNPAEVAAMRKANACYYQRYVEPQLHIRNLLDRAFPKE